MRTLLCAFFASMLAAGAAHAQTLEDAVLERINFARQYPQRYAETLRVYRGYFDGAVVYLPGDAGGIVTREGVAAVDEAIAFLERQAPLPPLERAAILTATAADYAREQGEIGARGHVGRDGAGPGDRVRRHGGGVYVGEGIAYGFADADGVVRQMIVDDGVANRGHRVLLFDRDFRFAGVGCGPHKGFDYLCVVDISATVDGSPMRSRLAERR